ncbi:hypothetical protein SUBVAR_04977 [Subdoligranulum variabile DSM 15176]|uniref:Uncharacterized protein n=1 Tax=Subdoligranulum variabile DSM 15176 TaxID=411471 RepID=D1PKU2_9FIRM|nr:hypothetical protein SUBVAR_04977 [Subdoligranulum variabile DSM 15176]
MLNASAFLIVFLLLLFDCGLFVRTRLTLFMVKENSHKNKGKFHRKKCEKIIQKKQHAKKYIDQNVQIAQFLCQNDTKKTPIIVKRPKMLGDFFKFG